MKCKVTDCDGKYKGLGYCTKHYQRFKKRGTIEGFAKREYHGLKSTPEYETWIGMKKRCYNKNTSQYKDWGGRGIKVCEEWKESFLSFYNYVGKRPTPKHSIDRINNNGNYEPGNIRWTTRQEQALNKRVPRHHFRKIRNSTGYRGVYVYKDYWVAKLFYKGKLLHLGSHQNPKDAAIAYDKTVIRLYPETAILNFPERIGATGKIPPKPA